ncbi:MAG TPA: HDIG domain-containing protein [Gemmatimonadales bacterium]|nr:HDIG domain-containing protein [Gemmatimonadales bacterium]
MTRFAAIRYHTARWLWVAALAWLTQAAFPSSAGDLASMLEIGARVDRTVTAPFDFVVSKSDDELRREADEVSAAAPPVFEVRPRTYDSVRVATHDLFAAMDSAAAVGGLALTRVSERVSLTLPPRGAEYLMRDDRRARIERSLEDLFQRTLQQGVMAANALGTDSSPEVIVRRGATEAPVDREQLISFEEVLRLAQAAAPDRGSAVGDSVYLTLVRFLFRPTLVRNELETARRRSELAAGVDRSKYAVRQGDVIIRGGEIATGPVQEKLSALHAELVRRGAATSRSVGGVIGPLIRNALILSVFWVLLVFYRRETYVKLRQVATVATLFACVILAAAAVAHTTPEHVELILLPFTAMMLTVLINGRVSMIAAMILAVLIGVQPVLHDTPALFLCFVGGVTAALSVKTLRRRTHLYLAVLLVGLGYLAAAFALGLAGDWPARDIGTRALLGTANGLVSASLTILLLPVAERVAQITTDLTLLELSDPSRPLLRRLSLEAPGTYAHSVAMANLVEAACNRIGANGLLGRVGCYYHDIGKLANPQYFVENQALAGNPHDRLAAAQSVEIIKHHVPEGLRLAREAGLPEVVAAFIPEHHGTSEITYFYDRAKKQGEAGLRRDDFRYPGPRPRSVETAIAMLADSVEASLRVLEAPTPSKLEAAIDQIVRNRLASGQLDEAPLTLRQADEVRAEFVRVLTGMYHNRIGYPEASGGITKTWQPARPAAGG